MIMILDKLRDLSNLAVVENTTVLEHSITMAYPLMIMSALSATVLISGIGYTYTFNRFQERSRVNIQSFKDGFQVDVLLLRFSIVAIFSHDHQIAVIPFHNINISFQAIGCPEADVVSPKTKGSEAIAAAK